MAKQAPTNRQFVVATAPGPRRWLWLAMVVALVALLLWFTDRHARRDAVENLDSLLSERAQLRTELAQASVRVAELEQQNAVAERARQVASNAVDSLRESLDQRQEQLAALRSDLEFYQRLLGTGGEQQGLAVHSLDLYPTSSERVYRFELTLVQNMRKATVVEGRVELSILGTENDQARTLSDSVALDDGDEQSLDFAFKYFQQLDGRIELPPEFVADGIRIRLVPARGSNVQSEYDWQVTEATASSP